MNSNIENPIVEFENLIQHDGLKILYHDFVSDIDYHYGTNVNEEKTAYEMVNFDPECSGNVIVQTFHNKLKYRLDEGYIDACKILDIKLPELQNNNLRKEYVHLLLDRLYYLIQKVEKIDTHGEESTVKEYILKIVEYVSFKYSSLIIPHAILNLMTDEHQVSNNDGFFQFNKQMSYIPKILHVLQKLNFIDDEPETFANFRAIIISDNPKILNLKITIHCSVEEASYIFFKLQDYFKNFTFKNIEESGCFLNKSKRLFKANTLSSSKNQFLNNYDKEDQKAEIDAAFETIKSNS
jgi:hypothetical protein